MSDIAKHSVSVAGVVVDRDDRVLLIQRRDNGHWEPPGGVLELNETIEDGVKREVLEETGIHVEVERITGVYKNLKHGVIALVFRCSPSAGYPRATAEAAAAKWIERSRIHTMMATTYLVRVTDAFTTRCHTRNHNGQSFVHPDN